MNRLNTTLITFERYYDYRCLRNLAFTVSYGRDGDEIWIESIWIEEDGEQQDLYNLVSHSYYREVDGTYHALEDLILERLWEQLH